MYHSSYTFMHNPLPSFQIFFIQILIYIPYNIVDKIHLRLYFTCLIYNVIIINFELNVSFDSQERIWVDMRTSEQGEHRPLGRLPHTPPNI